jgi:hypothetical protein
MYIGCGSKDCVNKINNTFCSRSCKNAAIRDKFINDYSDINHQVSNLLLKDEAHQRLFSKDEPPKLQSRAAVLGCGGKDKLPKLQSHAVAVLGCGSKECVNKTNNTFCSRSCKNAALRDNLIDDKDIDYSVSNLLLKDEAYRNLGLF